MTPTDRFDAALAMASALHRRQKRKGTDVPYVAHVLAVCALVMEDGGGEDEAVAALLHDSLEDCGEAFPGGREGLRREIGERFGGRVLRIVEDCTDDEGRVKGKASGAEEERVRWRGRKAAYVAHLRNMGDAGSRRVSCADKLHNARSILRDYAEQGEALWRRFRTGRAEDQLWYCGELAQVFEGPGLLEAEFRAVVAEMMARVAG
jgi:(p)ppGpp synthase/HD superfamily hydrolase